MQPAVEVRHALKRSEQLVLPRLAKGQAVDAKQPFELRRRAIARPTILTGGPPALVVETAQGTLHVSQY